MDQTNWILLCVVLFIVGALASGLLTGYFLIKKNKKAKSDAENLIQDAQNAVQKAKAEAEKITQEANDKADRITSLAREESRKEIDQLKKEAEDDINDRKNIIATREASLDNRELSLTNRETIFDEKKNEFEKKVSALEIKEKEVDAKIASITSELEKIAKMSQEEAKAILMNKVEEQEAKRIALYKEQMEEEARSEAADRARTIMCLSMEKFAQDVTSEHSTSTVALPNDEMKGRIIGREGRNIKSMEALFGVSLIIDDTPETITCSCFDPIRREKAKRTLEALIRDGRIQPGRIEDIYNKVSAELDDTLRRIGEQTVFKLGLPRINSGLYPYIGRLKFRTSYGQNVLDHSIQVAYLSSVMAAELGLDPVMAKRAGLLHDIGKAIDAEQEGSHVQLGVQLAKKFGEPDQVINAIESHHGDVPKAYLISEIVTAADTLSAARPGARSETLEGYIKRLEQLESICGSFEGVQTTYALQSGRDLRVMVVPEKISDEDAKALSIQIRDKIESEMEFPGQIKISVIRETRAVQIAK